MLLYKAHHMINLAVDSIVVGAMFLGGVLVDEKTMTSLGTLTAVCGLVFWIGKKWQRVDDRLERIEEKVQSLEGACDCQKQEKQEHKLRIKDE